MAIQPTDRAGSRRLFFEVWHKQQERKPLSALESIVADVIRLHPEYHPLLSGDPAKSLDRDWQPEGGETNPFLHMGLHIAIREQISIDRPVGVRAAYDTLLKQHGNPHVAEHVMLECLAEALWHGQRDGRLPDEAAYLACLRSKAGK